MNESGHDIPFNTRHRSIKEYRGDLIKLQGELEKYEEKQIFDARPHKNHPEILHRYLARILPEKIIPMIQLRYWKHPEYYLTWADLTVSIEGDLDEETLGRLQKFHQPGVTKTSIFNDSGLKSNEELGETIHYIFYNLLYNILINYEDSTSIGELGAKDSEVIPGRRCTTIIDPDSSGFIGVDLDKPSLTRLISTAIHHIIDAEDVDKEFSMNELREKVIERLRRDHSMLSLRTKEFQRSFQRAIRNVFHDSYDLSRDERRYTLAMTRGRSFPKITIERNPEPPIREGKRRRRERKLKRVGISVRRGGARKTNKKFQRDYENGLKLYMSKNYPDLLTDIE